MGLGTGGLRLGKKWPRRPAGRRDWSRRKRGWRDFRYAPTVGREKRGSPARRAKGGAKTGEEFNKTHTKFVFLRPSPDGSIVGVV